MFLLKQETKACILIVILGTKQRNKGIKLIETVNIYCDNKCKSKDG